MREATGQKAHYLFKWDSILIEPNETSSKLALENLAKNKIHREIFKNDEKLLPDFDKTKNYVIASNPPWFEGEGDHEKETLGGEVDFCEKLIKVWVSQISAENGWFRRWDKNSPTHDTESLSHDCVEAVCLLIGKNKTIKRLSTKAKMENMSTFFAKMDRG